MSDLTTSVKPSEWRKVVTYRRSVVCPGDCGYMAEERLTEPEDTAYGCCTKCGHVWSKSVGPSEHLP